MATALEKNKPLTNGKKGNSHDMEYLNFSFVLVFLPLSLSASFNLLSANKSTLLFSILYYLLCGFCHTAGYHRFFTHGSFKTNAVMKTMFLLFGSGNFMGSVLSFARDHRKHHKHMNTPQDPYMNSFWTWNSYWKSIECSEVDDLKKDVMVTLQHRTYPMISFLVGYILPAVCCHYLTDDFMGGLLLAGFVRSCVFLYLYFITWPLGHVLGEQPYSKSSKGRNSLLLNLITLGENSLNSHEVFPNDYRMGVQVSDVDVTKWVLKLLSIFGLVWNLEKTPQRDILQARVQTSMKELEKVAAEIDFGPRVQDLPRWSLSRVRDAVSSEGRFYFLMDGFVYDLESFIDSHPGGASILKNKVGKDITVAFNGGVQRHSKAARNLACMYRVAQLVEEATDI